MKLVNKDALIEIIQSSTSIAEILRRAGMSNSGNSRNIVKRVISDNKINTDHIMGQSWSKGKTVISDHRLSSKKPEDIFKENSISSRAEVRRLVVKEKLLPYKCHRCGLGDIWNGEPITLQLDHINGISNDHRLSNLRFLCPNCHSQTTTYCVRNTHRKISDVEIITASIGCSSIREVMVKLNKDNGRYYARFKRLLPHLYKPNIHHTVSNEASIYNARNKSDEWKKKIGLSNRRCNWPTPEKLSQLIKEKSMVDIGKMYGVSDNAIRKWCKKLKVDIHR